MQRMELLLGIEILVQISDAFMMDNERHATDTRRLKETCSLLLHTFNPLGEFLAIVHRGWQTNHRTVDQKHRLLPDIGSTLSWHAMDLIEDGISDAFAPLLIGRWQEKNLHTLRNSDQHATSIHVQPIISREDAKDGTKLVMDCRLKAPHWSFSSREEEEIYQPLDWPMLWLGRCRRRCQSNHEDPWWSGSSHSTKHKSCLSFARWTKGRISMRSTDLMQSVPRWWSIGVDRRRWETPLAIDQEWNPLHEDQPLPTLVSVVDCWSSPSGIDTTIPDRYELGRSVLPFLSSSHWKHRSHARDGSFPSSWQNNWSAEDARSLVLQRRGRAFSSMISDTLVENEISVWVVRDDSRVSWTWVNIRWLSRSSSGDHRWGWFARDFRHWPAAQPQCRSTWLVCVACSLLGSDRLCWYGLSSVVLDFSLSSCHWGMPFPSAVTLRVNQWEGRSPFDYLWYRGWSMICRTEWNRCS